MWLADGAMCFGQPVPNATQVKPGVWSLPWTLENAIALTEERIPCISPMARDYPFPARSIKPYGFQIRGSDFLARTRRGYMLADMGTGKTLMALWAIDYLLERGIISKVLVVCPKNIVYSAWVDEIRKHLPHLSYSAVIGTRKQKEKALNKRADIYIINHDGVHYELDLLQQHKFDLVAYDESTALGDTMAQRHKALRKLLTPNMWFWEMTGTPTPQNPMPAHGQIRLMGNVDQAGRFYQPYREAVRPFFTKTAWKSLTMDQEYEWRWTTRADANEKVHRFMQPAYRVSKAEVLKDIKEPVQIIRDVEMTKEQLKAIEELRRDRLHFAATGTVEAVNAAVLLTKIIQIACGCAYGESDGIAGDNDGEGRRLVEFSAKHKEEQLLELLEGAEYGKLVYVPYRSAVERVAAVCRKAKYRTVTVTGATTPREFGRIMEKFQARASDAAEVIVAIPQKMSHGVTATAADLTVWYAPVMRAEVFAQANNRMNRIGQDKLTRIATIAACDTERKIYERLQAMNLNESALLNMYENFMGGGKA